MPLTTGQVLQNRYRIAALLGEGGMGAVYRAWDLRLKKPVALKEMVPQPGIDAPTLTQFRTQFEQEAVVLGKLSHPHLVLVSDYFEELGNDYLVMAFVEGENLADRITREGALPEAQVVAWAQQLLGALAYCHRRSVIHRDIKPQNVVITPDGDAVLVDFGLVKLWNPADPRTRTAMRGMGTPEYAPPEQWGAAGQHTDPRSDLYSLGATLYHALSGQAPPTASDRMAYPKQFKTPRELTGQVSENLDTVIVHSMALSCDDRWPDARAMAHELTVAAQLPMAGLTRPGSSLMVTKVISVPEAPSVSQPRLNSALLWGGALFGVALLAVIAFLVARIVGGLGSIGNPAEAMVTTTPVATITPAPNPREVYAEWFLRSREEVDRFIDDFATEGKRLVSQLRAGSRTYSLETLAGLTEELSVLSEEARNVSPPDGMEEFHSQFLEVLDLWVSVGTKTVTSLTQYASGNDAASEATTEAASADMQHAQSLMAELDQTWVDLMRSVQDSD